MSQPDPILQSILKRVPQWEGAEDLSVNRLEGLTNTNYLVKVRGEKFALRVSGKNTAILGIDRQYEFEAITAASQAGIAPEIVAYLLPEGHLVTRFIEGHHWSWKEYQQPENLDRLILKVKQLHALPPIQAVFSPFRRVERFLGQAQSMGVVRPPDLALFTDHAALIERQQSLDSGIRLCFCHNDLFCVNVIDSGEVRFIDWEFAGMGDLYYDLATLFYAYDSDGSLTPEMQNYVLESYFGEVTKTHWERLKGMQFMLKFFSAAWGLVQQGLVKTGKVEPVEGFDYQDYSETTFEFMRAGL